MIRRYEEFNTGVEEWDEGTYVRYEEYEALRVAAQAMVDSHYTYSTASKAFDDLAKSIKEPE